MRFKPKKSWLRLFLLIVLLFLIGWWIVFQINYSGGQDPTWGITFSPAYAQELDLDWQEVYLAILDDLEVDHLRLAAYWDQIEGRPDKYDFSQLDWQISQAVQRDASIILAVGRRLPRWPECHEPAWARSLDEAEFNAELFEFIQTVIERYQNNEVIKVWQVENEPLLRWFGQCPPPDKELLMQEIEFVRSLDGTRPIIITDSGELSTWQPAASVTDFLGTTMYRIVWNEDSGFFSYWFVPPAIYTWKANLTQRFNPNLKQIIVTELQMEPWATGKPIDQLSQAERELSFDLKRFDNHLKYVTKTGFKEVYLWGVEYWYWLKGQGDPAMWDQAKKLWQ